MLKKKKEKIILLALHVDFDADEDCYNKLEFIEQDLMGEIGCCVNHYELIRIEEFERKNKKENRHFFDQSKINVDEKIRVIAGGRGIHRGLIK